MCLLSPLTNVFGTGMSNYLEHGIKCYLRGVLADKTKELQAVSRTIPRVELIASYKSLDVSHTWSKYVLSKLHHVY